MRASLPATSQGVDQKTDHFNQHFEIKSYFADLKMYHEIANPSLWIS